MHMARLVGHHNGNGAAAVHRIHRIFAEVLNHPLKQIAVERDEDVGRVLGIKNDTHFGGDSGTEIGGEIADDDDQILLLQFGYGTNF